MEVSELGVVDEAGLAFLAELRRKGVELEGLSPYLRLRLDLRAESEGRTAEGSSSEATENSVPNEVHLGRGENE